MSEKSATFEAGKKIIEHVIGSVITGDMPAEITVNGVTYIRADSQAAPSECQAHSCSYYKHYLLFYDPEQQGNKLEHEPYHEAERQCEKYQNWLFQWMDNHDGDPEILAPDLMRQVKFWEKKVAA